MRSQPSQQIITIHIWPNISRVNGQESQRQPDNEVWPGNRI